MVVYHYTSIDAMKEILTCEGLNFKAFYYSKYDLSDYAWTIEKVTSVIKDICCEKGWYFDEDDPVDPFFVSFCKNGYSDNMWRSFSDDYCGVQLVLDSEFIEKCACKDYNPDVYMNCIYTDNQECMKSFLLGKGWDGYLSHTNNDMQGDLKDISVFILKPCFYYEQEYRYMIPHRKKITFTRDGEFSEEVINDKEYKYVLFPKEALIGINLGCESDVELSEIYDLLEQREYINIRVSKGINRYE